MNLTETEKLLTMMTKAYSRYFKEFNAEDFFTQARMWQRSLADYDFKEAVNAMEFWINTEEYPPTLAGFKAVAAKFRNSSAFLSGERAWEIVSNAVRKFGSYGQEKAFADFSETIKRAVYNVGGWQKICQTELGREWDFLRKNFIEAYNDFGQEERQREILPMQVLQRLIEPNGDRFKIEKPK